MKLTISRKRWLRGEGTKRSYLYRPDDKKMCCLGFLARECNIKAIDINGYKNPGELPTQLKSKWPKGTFQINHVAESTTIQQLMVVNDRVNKINGDLFLDSDREDVIAKLMKKIGVEVIFVD